jgi:hypothetical protein
MEIELAEKLRQEEIRQKVQEEKDELKRLGIKNNWFGTPEIRPRRLESSMPVLVVEDVDDSFSFMPKELASTMPVLVVSEKVKALEKNLDVLHIGESAELEKLTGSDLEAQLLSYASEHHKGGFPVVGRGAGDLAFSRKCSAGESIASLDSVASPMSPALQDLKEESFVEQSPIPEELTANPHSPIFYMDHAIDEDEVIEVEERKLEMREMMEQSGAMAPDWGEEEKGKTI